MWRVRLERGRLELRLLFLLSQTNVIFRKYTCKFPYASCKNDNKFKSTFLCEHQRMSCLSTDFLNEKGISNRIEGRVALFRCLRYIGRVMDKALIFFCMSRRLF
jgi:hypothetical protein